MTSLLPKSAPTELLCQSPFATCLAPVRDQLPAAFQQQFLFTDDGHSLVRLDGVMTRIWRRSGLLAPIFHLFARWDMLFPETGRDIPAGMTITPAVDHDGRYGHRWRRTFYFAVPRYFDAIMVYDAERNCVVERMGPAQSIEVAWDVVFAAPTTLRIRTSGCSLVIGQHRLSLPRHWYPAVEAIETANVAGDDSIHIDLVVSHPFLGPVFGYEGIFTLHRIPRTAAV